MHSLNPTATKTFEQLIRGLDVGKSRKIGDGKTFMRVHVERLTEDLYSVAHYTEQNGDLIADPDMEVWQGNDGRYYPIALQQFFGYTRAVEFGDKSTPTRCNVRAQRELASFAAMWMRNIRQQQPEWFAGRKRSEAARG